MRDERRRRWLVPLLVCLLVLAADQVSKYYILQALGPEPLVKVVPVVGDWFNLVYLRNTGVAFSLFQDMSLLFSIVALLISAGAIYIYAQHLPNRRLIVQVSIGLIEGGALGNVIDRLRLGYVVDFIQVGWWPVFNLADSAISVGAVMLAVYLLRLDRGDEW
jgi:signal peptidase II